MPEWLAVYLVVHVAFGLGSASSHGSLGEFLHHGPRCVIVALPVFVGVMAVLQVVRAWEWLGGTR